MMALIDRLLEKRARSAAQHASRRGLLKTLGGALVGASAVPLLPVARADGHGGPAHPQEQGSDTDCDYWRYCAIDGFLCSCCFSGTCFSASPVPLGYRSAPF